MCKLANRCALEKRRRIHFSPIGRQPLWTPTIRPSRSVPPRLLAWAGADKELFPIDSRRIREFCDSGQRAEKGVYLNVDPKYLLDYAVEIVFRSDTRRLPNGTQLRIALNIAFSVGVSKYWRGFTHGKHRTEELTQPTPRPAPSSGPRKGRSPISSVNGRPPR
jgi:hypothetical protein